MRPNIREIVLFVALAGCSAQSAFAQLPTVWYVDLQNQGTEDGTSWSTAFNTIEEAIAAADDTRTAEPFDEIWVKANEYTPLNVTTGFSLSRNVELYGGFAGDEVPIGETEVFDPRQFNAAGQLVHQTILSGDIGIPNDYADNVQVIVTAPGNDADYICDGFVIERARLHGITAIATGLTGSSGTFRNLIVRNNISDENTTTPGGAGMYVSFSSPAIDNCVFARNQVHQMNAAGGGGGVASDSASPAFRDCLFDTNVFSGIQGGGGLWANEGGVSLRNCRF